MLYLEEVFLSCFRVLFLHHHHPFWVDIYQGRGFAHCKGKGIFLTSIHPYCMANRLVILVDINIQRKLKIQVFTLELSDFYSKLFFSSIIVFLYLYSRVSIAKVPLVKEPAKVFSTYLLKG